MNYKEQDSNLEIFPHIREWNPRSISVTILKKTPGHTLDDWKCNLEQICQDLDCYCPEIQQMMLDFAITIEEGIKIAEQELLTR